MHREASVVADVGQVIAQRTLNAVFHWHPLVAWERNRSDYLHHSFLFREVHLADNGSFPSDDTHPQKIFTRWGTGVNHQLTLALNDVVVLPGNRVIKSRISHAAPPGPVLLQGIGQAHVEMLIRQNAIV